MDKIRAEQADARKELSFLCPGFIIPPYLSLGLTGIQRRSLMGNVALPTSRVEHDLDRPLRILFENGLELRLTPGPLLEIRALYHVHPWLLHRRPDAARKHPPRRAPFEQKEETMALKLVSWEKITDGEISNHARLALLSRRCGGKAPADLIDATLSREIVLAAPDFQIRISRPSGCGLEVSCVPAGRHRSPISDLPQSVAVLSGDEIKRAMRINADWINKCQASLPFWPRTALEVAAGFGPLLVGAGACALFLREQTRLALKAFARRQNGPTSCEGNAPPDPISRSR